MTWIDLEERMKNLFRTDQAMTVPGSGNGKGEEDVIGTSTITQCKFSSKKNITILSKDMKRLEEACRLHGKLPIFANENDGKLVISIPDNPILDEIIDCIVALAMLEKIQSEVDDCRNPTVLLKIDKYLTKVSRAANIGRQRISQRLTNVKRQIVQKYANLTQYNLFDKEQYEREDDAKRETTENTIR